MTVGWIDVYEKEKVLIRTGILDLKGKEITYIPKKEPIGFIIFSKKGE